MLATKEQLKCIEHTEGGLLLIAPAGSGKTSTIVNRVCNIIKSGCDPSRILCLTFTNKAGKEMRERIAKATNTPEKDLPIFTFHGFCNYWLRKEGHRIGIPQYTIADEDITNTLIGNIAASTVYNVGPFKAHCKGKQGDIHELEADYLEHENSIHKKAKIKEVKNALNNMAKQYLSIDKVKLSKSAENHIEFVKKCVTAYEKEKKHRNYLDFNDLEAKGIDLFNVVDMSIHYDYVMADECQDQSEVDLILLQSLNIKNMCAVGDMRQSIFGFRGAIHNGFERFKVAFNAKELHLTKNFRSDRTIVELANTTVGHLGLPNMVPSSTKKGVIAFLEFKTQQEQMNTIMTTITNFTKK